MIPQHEFYQALRIALSMVPDSHPKLPELASLLIECSLDGELRLVGSDGERIVVVKLRCEHGQEPKTAMRVSRAEAESMVLTLRFLTGANDLTFCWMGETLMITDGVACATCTALPGAYPDYRAVMHHKPGDKGPRAFRRADLAEALAILEPLTDTVELYVNGLLGPGYIEWKGDGVIKSVVMGFSPVVREAYNVSKRD
jgi:DNA polymerase III sliding clamp (beta) subunit (PCNA family)